MNNNEDTKDQEFSRVQSISGVPKIKLPNVNNRSASVTPMDKK